jgi:hypothetical protein
MVTRMTRKNFLIKMCPLQRLFLFFGKCVRATWLLALDEVDQDGEDQCQCNQVWLPPIA